MTQQFDSKDLRRVMSQFATGITVVTTLDRSGVPAGMTANSFASVSLDPPLILLCVDQHIEFFRVITEADHFCVNFLTAAQESLSRQFATRGIDKFAGVEYEAGKTGVPVLRGTLGHVECSRYELLPGGDHIIVLGKVEFLNCAGGEPLMYFGSRYRLLQPGEPI